MKLTKIFIITITNSQENTEYRDCEICDPNFIVLDQTFWKLTLDVSFCHQSVQTLTSLSQNTPLYTDKSRFQFLCIPSPRDWLFDMTR